MMIHRDRPMSPAEGDIWLFATSDSIGRYNRVGKHTNFGYSGYVVAVVYNGKHWARLTRSFLESLGVSETSFEFQYEVPGVIGKVEKEIEIFLEQHPHFVVKVWPYRGKFYAKLQSEALTQSDSAI